MTKLTNFIESTKVLNFIICVIIFNAIILGLETSPTVMLNFEGLIQFGQDMSFGFWYRTWV